MARVLSGIQPTGNIHLGNYLGALKNWVDLQHQFDCLFCLVDLHALTVRPSPEELRESTLLMAAAYIAAGVDPKKSAIFVQSQVAAHAELMWILGCYTPLGWLNRMTQFKEKAGKDKEKAVLGLYSYPVLMAADILLYAATDVPVGEDQKQHIEIARDIALSFNHHYDMPLFTVPEPRILGSATRVMSLRDGTKKMSKSDPAEGARIGLFDDPEIIFKKIQKATTDSLPFPEVYDESLEKRPEVRNLIHIYAALSNKSQQDVCRLFGGGQFAPFKKALGELCVTSLRPFQENYHRLMQDKAHLFLILKKGKEKAEAIAHKTLARVKETVGFIVE